VLIPLSFHHLTVISIFAGLLIALIRVTPKDPLVQLRITQPRIRKADFKLLRPNTHSCMRIWASELNEMGF
jgi:hypothetical protein